MRVASPGPGSRVATGLVTLFMVATAVCVWLPFNPVLPGLGLDPSWRLGINEAVARGLVFGSQLVFTFGPYASVFTTAYHPSVAPLTLVASAWIALAWAACLRRAAPPDARWLPIAFCLMVAAVSASRDVLFLSYPMLFTIALFRRLADDRTTGWSRDDLLFVFAGAALGLLALVKATFVIVCIGTTGLAALSAIQRRMPSVASLCVASPIAAVVVFWSAAGQPVAALPQYFASTVTAVSGYTQAMSIPGDWRDAAALIAVAVLLLAALGMQPRTPGALRVFLTASFAFHLFVGFKAAFVRPDDDHIPIMAGPLLLASLCLPLVVRTGSMRVAALAGIAYWIAIGSRYDPDFLTDLPVAIAAPYRSAGTGIATRWNDPVWPANAYERALARIRIVYPFPRLNGTTDVYSDNQAGLIAAGNDWSPRPVFQSYAAYDAPLLAVNARHLEGPLAPANVLFSVEAIDARVPAFDDGASWLGLLTHYRATDLQGRMLVLRRDAAPAPPAPDATTTSRHAMGERVPLPASTNLLFARFEIRPTLFGRLRELLYKSDVPMLVVELDDGSQRTYRLLPRIARSEFLLSPLVEDTDDFARLFGVFDDLSPKRISAFTVRLPDGAASLWESGYDVALIDRANPQDGRPRATGLPRHQVTVPAPDEATSARLVGARCGGAIERPVALRAASQDVPRVSRTLRMQGWLSAPSGGDAPNVAYLVLTDAHGRRAFARMNRALRADRVARFDNLALAHSGYFATVDLSRLAGAYTLGLASNDGERWTLCENFDRRVWIDPPGADATPR